jgi:predicted membrane channel-forming protein YqfA (hemolysin III family)
MGRSWAELGRQVGRHTHYADGAARPQLRGWLHGAVAACAIPAALAGLAADRVPAAAVPPTLAICLALVCSSALHLYPFIAASSWERARRLDRCCVLLISATSYFSPQLTSTAACQPPLSTSVASVLLPNAIGAAFALRGAEGPAVFLGAAIAAVPTTRFWASYDPVLASYSCTALLLYGAGLAVHATQPAEPAERWGHHEWAHVLITLGLLANALGALRLGHTCA